MSAWGCTFPESTVHSMFLSAAARLQAPLVALSTDLPDRGVEQRRNAEIIALHRQGLLICDQNGINCALAMPGLAVSSASPFAQLWDESALMSRPVCGPTNKHTQTHTHTHILTQTNKQTNNHPTNKHTNKQSNTPTHKQTNNQTYKQTNKQTNKRA